MVMKIKNNNHRCGLNYWVYSKQKKSKWLYRDYIDFKSHRKHNNDANTTCKIEG